MAIYKISDIFDSLKSMKDDGYEYVDISEVDPDPDDPDDSLSSLFLDAIVSDDESETDIIDAVELPDGYYRLP